MKKQTAIEVLIFLLMIALAAAGTYYFYNYFKVSTNFKTDLSFIDQAIKNIETKISTPPPLRVQKNVPESVLTVSGVLEWTNKNRQDNNLAALKLNSQLNQAATGKVNDMFAKQYFEHVSPTGLGPAYWVEKSGYAYIAIGENLALGNFVDDKDLLDAWMASPGHRANILNTGYKDIGIAVKKGTFEGNTVWLAVQEFGRPRAACPAIDNNLKIQFEANQKQLDEWQVQIESLKLSLANPPKGRVTQEEADAYNALVAQYNDLIKQYNNLVYETKNLIDEYNAQVQVYNACANQ